MSLMMDKPDEKTNEKKEEKISEHTEYTDEQTKIFTGSFSQQLAQQLEQQSAQQSETIEENIEPPIAPLNENIEQPNEQLDENFEEKIEEPSESLEEKVDETPESQNEPLNETFDEKNETVNEKNEGDFAEKSDEQIDDERQTTTQDRIKAKSKNRRRKSAAIIFIIALIFIFIVSAIVGVFLAVSNFFGSDNERKSSQLNSGNETKIVATDKMTVMIMGVDERSDDVGRSDTLMIATIDPKKDTVSLLSIPRDTRVHMGKYGWDKINAAYAYGGRKLTQNTVENFLDADIEHYVLINTRSFPKIIDAIGGVDIDVEKRMYYVDEWDDALPGGLVIDLQKGQQHLNGETAMAYVRYRDEEGDIGRIRRQQKFVQAVLNQLTSPTILPHIPSIIREALNAFETDLSFRDIIAVANALKTSHSTGLKTEMVQGSPTVIDGINYWIPDIEQARTVFANMLDIPITTYMRHNMERDNATSRETAAAGERNRSPLPTKSERDQNEQEEFEIDKENDAARERNLKEPPSKTLDDLIKKQSKQKEKEKLQKNSTKNQTTRQKNQSSPSPTGNTGKGGTLNRQSNVKTSPAPSTTQRQSSSAAPSPEGNSGKGF